MHHISQRLTRNGKSILSGDFAENYSLYFGEGSLFLSLQGFDLAHNILGGADILSAVRESAAYLMSGAVDYEFRTTVVDPLHTEEDIRAIGAWLRGAKRYYLQSFVDSGDLIGEGMRAYDPQTMERLCAAAAEYIPTAALRGI